MTAKLYDLSHPEIYELVACIDVVNDMMYNMRSMDKNSDVFKEIKLDRKELINKVKLVARELKSLLLWLIECHYENTGDRIELWCLNCNGKCKEEKK